MRWLRCFRPQARPRMRLICFPHAGGNAAFFRDWAPLLPDGVELYGVQYPGRLDRINEPLLHKMEEVAAQAAAVIAPLGPAVLFGHSLGAWIAFEVAMRLPRPPIAVVVSGHPAPHRRRNSQTHLADDDTLWAEMGRLGGTSADLLAHDSIRSLMLPALRADYEIAETHHAPIPAPITAPILAVIGDADPEVTAEEADDWRQHTTAGFRLLTLPGDHFYLIPHEAALVASLPLSAGGGP
jgi:pyochelin biosynthetic protein PchC